ncbi:unnamed protein product [Moneuplotes crassus]|uniref:Uncharacterized protein n=1 Tax=Euplotes crassus TaxID=5936 RepID=A0AAD2D0A2_EUPCR|nr:unnamed protein product [Moneuplotes crassus]
MEPVFGRPSFPSERPPTVKELFQEEEQTAVNRDYTKNYPRTIYVSNPENIHVKNTMRIKECMSALLRNQEREKLRHKIKKTDQHFISEKEDNYRKHLFDPHTQSWRFDYDESSLVKNDPQGPFLMSKVLTHKINGRSPPSYKKSCSTALTDIPNIPESDSVKATISSQSGKGREHDFEGINVNLKETKNEVDGAPRRTLKEPVEEDETFIPQVISSSFIKKRTFKNLDEYIERSNNLDRRYPDKGVIFNSVLDCGRLNNDPEYIRPLHAFRGLPIYKADGIESELDQ